MNNLKLAQLKFIAFKCGIATTGTKAVLSTRIDNEMNHLSKESPKNKRILSIDMGIRNLAYCTLDVGRKLSTPSVYAWQNLALSMTPLASPTQEPIKSDKEENIAEEKVSSSPSMQKVMEKFDPATMSNIAYSLLRQKLLLQKPTHVIIEQQRFRSHGNIMIQEWTLRVNMLEAILHAILCTLRAEGIWKGSISAVSPARVGPYWLDEINLRLSQTNKKKADSGSDLSCKAKLKYKRMKVELVRNWIGLGTKKMTLGNRKVRIIAERYQSRSKNILKTSKTYNSIENISPVAGKLDDLSDSLLQGLAWLEWEENKKILAEHGPEAILCQ